MLNQVQLIGRLGADPEIRYTPDGQMVANIRIATDETWKDKSGEKQQRTEWHRCVAFGKLAEIVGQYLAKGRQVFIQGRIQTRSWEDKEGVKRYTTEVIALTMKMLGSSSGNGSKSDAAQPDDPGAVPDGSIPEDDVPF